MNTKPRFDEVDIKRMKIVRKPTPAQQFVIPPRSETSWGNAMSGNDAQSTLARVSDYWERKMRTGGQK